MAEVTLQELLEAGVHFGHQARRWNPAMAPYIYGERDQVHVFDLAKTKAGLEAAREFAAKTAADGGKVLYVGTKRQAAGFVRQEALRAGMPYVIQRWMGGTLTNFAQLTRSIQKLAKLKDQREKGELKKYTKREQLLIDREIGRLEKFLGGIAQMDRLPQAMFIVDTHREDVAVREANRMKIPVIGLVDSNADPDKIDYVIPGNDDAVKAIELVVREITDAISGGGDVKVQEEKPKKTVKKTKKTAPPEEAAGEANG